MNSTNTLILNIPPFWLKAGISKSSSGILVVAESVFTTSVHVLGRTKTLQSTEVNTGAPSPAVFFLPAGAVQTAPAEQHLM